ncbi:MAG TPA: OB-fold nucleic acid binding domain-containing protein [Actinomycetota bacterium]
MFGRLLHRFAESDEDRLANEVRAWADSMPETIRISDVRERARVRLAGVVRRITLHPGPEGAESLSAVLSDGTGEIVARWTGRGEIGGLRLGSRVLLEGVVARERGRLQIVNPSYEFA